MQVGKEAPSGVQEWESGTEPKRAEPGGEETKLPASQTLYSCMPPRLRSPWKSPA